MDVLRAAHRCLSMAFVSTVIACVAAPKPPSEGAPVAPRASASPSVAASVEVPVEAPPAAPPTPTLPPRRSALGGTRDTIACGEERCDAAKEKCVTLLKPAPAWSCVPRESTSDNYNDIFDCDDGTDCPWGKTCCLSFASANTAYVCATRKMGDDCRMEVCEPGGARCPVGQVCTNGFCLPEKRPGPRCGAKHCTGATPYCVWAGGKGTCAGATEAQAAVDDLGRGGQSSVLECTESRDCGPGFSCCTGMALGTKQSHCSVNCDSANSMKYCSTDADCPTVPGPKLRCQRPKDAGLPAWSKLCLPPE